MNIEKVMKEMSLHSENIDITSAMERFSYNKDLYIKFLFKIPFDENFTNGIRAYEKGDFTAVEFAIHTLKGISGNLSLTRLFAICNDIVLKCRNKDYCLDDDILKLEEEYKNVLSIIDLCKKMQ